jgi:hypothetical protein
MTALYKIIDILAWINGNTVGILGILLAVYATKKTLGYFEKKHIE